MKYRIKVVDSNINVLIKDKLNIKEGSIIRNIFDFLKNKYKIDISGNEIMKTKRGYTVFLNKKQTRKYKINDLLYDENRRKK